MDTYVHISNNIISYIYTYGRWTEYDYLLKSLHIYVDSLPLLENTHTGFSILQPQPPNQCTVSLPPARR